MGHAADAEEAAEAGHRDMVRMSDARMSGTSYGACVLHVAPESYIGGPLALLQTGDIVSIDVDARTHPHGSGRRGTGSAAAPHGRRRPGVSNGATATCSPSTFSRPTRAAISTSCEPNMARQCPSR